MASIQEVIKQMHSAGESHERITAVIDAYKKNKAKDAEAQDQAKRIASYLKPTPAPKVIPKEEKVIEEVKGVEKKETKEKEQEQSLVDQPPTAVAESTSVKPNTNTPVVTETLEEADKRYEKEQERVGHITLDQLNDTSDVSVFGDKETGFIANLEKSYKNDKLKFEIKNEWGTNDTIVVTDEFGRKHEINPGSNTGDDKMMTNLHKWVDKGREMNSSLEGEEPLTNAEVDEVAMSLPTYNNSTATEGTDTKILSLEKDIAALPVMSNAHIEKTAELANYTYDKRDNEFDQTSVKTAKKADKYNEELKGKLDQHASFMKSEGIEEGSPEWKDGLDRVRNQYNTGVGAGNLKDIEEYQGITDSEGIQENEAQEAPSVAALTLSLLATPIDAVVSTISGEEMDFKKKLKQDWGSDEYKKHTQKEIDAAAIANLMRDVKEGYSNDGSVEDITDKFKWLPEEDWYKLLDGLTTPQIQELSGMRTNGDDVGMENTLWNSQKKEAHVDAIKLKLLKQKSRHLDRNDRKNQDELVLVNKRKKDIVKEQEALDGRVTAFNGKMNPVIQKLEEIEGEKLLKEDSLVALQEELQGLPEPTTQEEVDIYNGKIKDYEKELATYNNFVKSSGATFKKYEELQKEGEILQADGDKFNLTSEEFNNNLKRFESEYETAATERQEIMGEYGFTVMDGMMKKTSSDYGSIKEYEEWRKKNKITKGFLDIDTYSTLAQGLVNTGAKYYTGTSLWGLNLLDGVTGGAISGGDERYSRLDGLNAMYEKYTNYDHFGKAQAGDYEEGEQGFFSKGSQAIAEGLPFMLAIAASSGKEAFKPGMFTKTIGKKLLDVDFANKIRAAQTGFRLTAMDNTLEGKALGLNPLQASLYGGTIGTITGMVQMIMPDAEFFKAGVIDKVMKEGFAGTLKQFTTREGIMFAGKRWGENVVKEVIEEEAEMVLGDVAKATFGLAHTMESTDINNHFKLIHDTVWLSGGMGAVGAKADFKGVQNNVINQLKGDTGEYMKTINMMGSELNVKLEKAKLDGDTDAVAAYEGEIANIIKTKNYVNNVKLALNIAPENVTNEQLADLAEKMRLTELKKKQDPSFHGEIDLQIEKIDAKISESVVEQKQGEVYDKTVANVTKMINGTKNVDGKTRTVAELKDDPKKGTAKEQLLKILNEKETKKDKDGNDIDGDFLYSKEDRDGVSKGDFLGTYITDKNGNKTLVINKEASKGTGDGVNVAAHEFLHDMMQTTFAQKDANGDVVRDQDGNIKIDKKKAIAIGGQLADWVVNSGVGVSPTLTNRMSQYNDQGNEVQFQEIMTILSDSMVSGDMKFEEGPFTKLGDIMRRGLQKAGVPVKFNTGKDVFNFIKDYNKSVENGNLSQAQKDVYNKGAIIGKDMQKEIDSSAVYDLAMEKDPQTKRDMLASMEVDPFSTDGKALLKSKPSNVEGLLNKYDGNKRKMISETLMRTKDGRSVMELKNNRGEYAEDNFFKSEFGQEIAPITETITKRLFDPIPDNLRAGNTRAKFLNELTVIASTLVEREFDPTKQNIDKFISNRLNLRANKLASDLGIESTVEEGGLGATVGLDKAAELTAEESGPITESTPGFVLLKRIASPETILKIQKKIRSKIKGTTIEVEPGVFVDIAKLNYKTLKNLVASEVAGIFGIKSVENYLSPTKTLKNDDVIRARMFIAKQASALKASLPLGITASGTATGTKQVIIKNFYTKSETRAKYDPKEGGAGIFPQIKNTMSDDQFTAPFGVIKGELTNVKGQNPATLISGLMDEVGKTITNQTVRQELDANNNGSDKEVAARIRLLGDGKSDAMYSLAGDINKIGKSNQIQFFDKVNTLSGNNLTVKDGNVTNALRVKFAEEIENGVYDVKGQTTAQFINKIGKRLQVIHDMYTRDGSVSTNFVFDGKSVADMVIEQFKDDASEDTVRYKSIVGDIDGLTTPEGEQSARLAAKDVAARLREKGWSESDIKKFFRDGLSANTQTGTGVRVYLDGSVSTYKLAPILDKKGKKKSFRNRFSFGSTSDMDALLGTADVDVENNYDSGDLRAYERPKTGEGIPSEKNMKNIVAEQQEANQKLKELTEVLTELYQDNKKISASDVVAILQAHNANPRGLTRMAAVLDFIPTGAYADYKGEFRLEHMTPALQINLSALNQIINPSAENNANFNDMMDGYKVAYLPMKYDNMVNKHYKSDTPVYANAKTPSIVRYYNLEMPGFDLEMKQLSTGQTVGASFVFDQAQQKLMRKNNTKAVGGSKLYFSKASDSDFEMNRKNRIVDKAVKESRLAREPRGITVLDFDDTLATTKSMIRYTKPDGTKGKLNAEQYASQFENLTELGYEWDFSEFNEVVKGQLAPLFNKAMKLQGKFGPENMFVLTARPAAAAAAINSFLNQHGLNIPMENITGLGNSTAEAKALWIAEKVGDGYNDFYFADDALQNVQAVQNMLDQFDVKSKVQLARKTLYSKASDTFNEILEDSQGINRNATFSDAKAQKRGANVGNWGIFIPASAEDFKGLIYKFLGKGKKGEQQLQWFKDTLMNPFARATQEMDKLKSRLSNDYNALNKRFPNTKKMLDKTVPTGDFTYDTAIRVYNWVKAGREVDGLSKKDSADLIKAVEQNPEMIAYAAALEQVTNGYPEPGDYWMTETIASDLNNMTEGPGRKALLQEFTQNREAIFGTWQNGKLVGPNMNKIEAVYGAKFRNALEDMLWRMENGTNRNFGDNALTNRFANWVNNSVGAIMFFNARSAVLQTLSTANFINWDFNNPLRAAQAFANQPQFWKDFSMIFNSDMLKQRRDGLRSSVSHAELAEAASNSKNPAKAVFQKLLKLGFLPTQIADSFAIASGGATFYRNRVNDLMKKGMSEVEAKSKAFTEFQQKAEETQQSSRPDMISQQQASPLGRLVLAFQNTPMQYTRLMKKAIMDIANGRGDMKHNISKIIYYGAVQNMIFSSLQKAMFAFAFDDDDEDDKKKQRKKEISMANGMLDSLLRGMGVGGAVVSTLKNMILKFAEENQKGWNADYDKVILEFLNLSPPIGSKARKLKSGFSTLQFNREVIDYMPKNTLDNPMWEVIGNIVSATTNIPLDRVINKTNNVREALNSDNAAWQRIALALGWNRWDVDVENDARNEAKESVEAIKVKARKQKEKDKKEAAKKKEAAEKKAKGIREVQCSGIKQKGKGSRCKNKTENKSGKCYAHQ